MRTGKNMSQKVTIESLTGVIKELTEEIGAIGLRSYADTDQLFETLDHILCNYREAVDAKYYPDEIDKQDETQLLKKIAVAAIFGVASYQCGQIKQTFNRE